MKKLSSLFCIFLALVLVFGGTGIIAHADEPTLTLRDVETYVFSLDHVTSTALLFRSDLPEAPYIDPVDYLSVIYTATFSQAKNDDGSYTVTAQNGEMIADVQKDTLYFADYEAFCSNASNKEGSTTIVTYARSHDNSYYTEPGEVVFDLGSYGIDVLEYGDKVYLPLATFCILFASNYSNGEYVGGKLCYLHSMDNMNVDGYFDKSSVYQSLTRSKELARFTYANLCFVFDFFYGRPTSALLAASVDEIGFDATLENYSDDTRLAKQALLSTNRCEYFAGLCILTDYFCDGGHTSLHSDPLGEAALYPSSPLFSAFLALMQTSEEPLYKTAKTCYLKAVDRILHKGSTQEIRAQALAAYEPSLTWNDGSALYVSGSSALFVFDSFTVNTAAQFKEAVDFAEAQGLKNFVIDVSCNGGGLVASGYYMMTLMLAKATGQNTFSTYTTNTTTGSVSKAVLEIDLNMDGVFDDADAEVSYDLNFAILSSKTSFSSGNLLPCMAKSRGIAILGEQSGGGACSIERNYLPDAVFFFMSSHSKFFVPGIDDVDLGAPVDYDLVTVDEQGVKDYRGLYDIERLGRLTEEYYRTHTVNAGMNPLPVVLLCASLLLLVAGAILLRRKRVVEN